MSLDGFVAQLMKKYPDYEDNFVTESVTLGRDEINMRVSVSIEQVYLTLWFIRDQDEPVAYTLEDAVTSKLLVASIQKGGRSNEYHD